MSAPACSSFCPFLACSSCSWQGGDSTRQMSLFPQVSVINSVETKRSPGAVLGRSGSTGDLTEIGARLMPDTTRTVRQKATPRGGV